ncbi:MAG: DUF6226 family protein [Propionibacteriaceae bacterium]|nr:DUF6226 family protein [Propionibacteriaceae bacterium]
MARERCRSGRWRLTGRSGRADFPPEAGWRVADSGYIRPSVTTPTCLDDHGEVIRFGTRWGEAGPPREAYSEVHHSERFAPIVTVAEAIIAYLTKTYDVVVEDISSLAQERELKYSFTPEIAHMRRMLEITPGRGDAARLLVGFTDLPSVELQAGAFFDAAFPGCGCDACDEEWSGCAARLDETVLAVARGAFSENIRGRRVETFLGRPEGSYRSSYRLKHLPYSAAYIARARRLLKPLKAGWQPWPKRQTTA